MDITNERVNTNELRPDINQGIVAAKEIVKIQEMQGSLEKTEDAIAVLNVYMSVLVDMLDPVVLKEFARRVDNHPIIREIAAKCADRRPSPDADSTEAGEADEDEGDDYEEDIEFERNLLRQLNEGSRPGE